MKEVICIKCGEIIEEGYAVNPQISALCAECYEEQIENLDPADL